MNVELRQKTYDGELSQNIDDSYNKYAPYDELHNNSAAFAADVQKYDLR